MISTVVRDCTTSTQNLLYSWQDEKNWTLTRFIATPLSALIDVSIECVTPVLQTIESVAFCAISLLAIAYYIVTLNPKEAGKATKMTLINLNEAIINILRFVGKSAISPFNFIGQIWLASTEHPTAKSSSENFSAFDLSPPGTRIGDMRNGIPFGSKGRLVTYAISLIALLFDGENYLGKKYPLVARVTAIPLVAIDTAISILTPLLSTVDTVFKILLAAVLIPFQNSKERKELLTAEFAGLNYIVDCLAHMISMVILSPITLVGQAFKTIYDPANASPAMFSLYGFYSPDNFKSAEQSYLTIKGMQKAELLSTLFGYILRLEKSGSNQNSSSNQNRQNPLIYSNIQHSSRNSNIQHIQRSSSSNQSVTNE